MFPCTSVWSSVHAYWLLLLQLILSECRHIRWYCTYIPLCSSKEKPKNGKSVLLGAQSTYWLDFTWSESPKYSEETKTLLMRKKKKDLDRLVKTAHSTFQFVERICNLLAVHLVKMIRPLGQMLISSVDERPTIKFATLSLEKIGQ